MSASLSPLTHVRKLQLGGLHESCLSAEVAELGHKAAHGPQSHTPEDPALPPPGNWERESWSLVTEKDIRLIADKAERP